MTTNDGATLADAAAYATRVAPPMAVTGASFLGLPLSEWVYIVTIAYTLLQTAYFIWKLVHNQLEKLRKDAKPDGGE
ncbi:putative holin [Caulobacter phage Cd1]|uniref:Putative holin n=1 Tax=Caulobacter phage Cd1 TaxID=718008 RepID=F1ADS4_9CAUD|nr:putative holin [Caulobacter phage Cd1]